MRTFSIVAAGLVFVVSLVVWAWLSGMGAGIGVTPPSATPQLIAYALPATGVGAGASLSLLVLMIGFGVFKPAPAPATNETGDPPAEEKAGETIGDVRPRLRPQADRAALLLGVAIAGIVILLLVTAVMGRINPISAALIIICGTLALFAGMHVVEGLARGETIEVNSHWGGLGGSMGGWRLSPLATMLIVALILLGATLAASGAFSGADTNSAANQSSGNETRPAGNQQSLAPGNGVAGAPTANQQTAPANDAAAVTLNAIGNAL